MRRISKYLERIVLSDQTNIIGAVDLVTINVETIRIESRYSMKKEFNK